MTRLQRAVLVAALALLAPAVAHADAFDFLPDGGAMYAAIRPAAVMGGLKRMGVGEMPEIQQLSKQFGGLDVLNPGLLGPTGIDAAGEAAALLFDGPQEHHRLAVPLRDVQIFKTFLAGVGAAQQGLTLAAPDSPAAKAGVLASFSLPDVGHGIIREKDGVAVIDVITSAVKKAPAPTDFVKRYPLVVKKVFVRGVGARQLFKPEAAAIVYADGRKLPELVLQASRSKKLAACKTEWSKVNGTFDDVALAFAIDPDAIKATLAWGMSKGATLKVPAADDGAVEVDLLRRQAPALIGLFTSSLQPFAALKRSPQMAGMNSLVQAVGRCDAIAWSHLLVRSWPQALGALIGGTETKRGGIDPMAQAMAAFGQMRNAVLILRDATDKSARWAAAATFDPSARPLFEMLLATMGGTPQTIGKRRPTVYHPAIEGQSLVAALENLKTGRLAFTLTDSDDTLSWALRSATPMPGAAPSEPEAPAIIRMHLDTVQIAKITPMLKMGRDAQQGFDLLARLKRIDADLRQGAGLFQLTARAPLK